ncbi:class I SAM-dependent methyltransferase [Natronoglycomyces albus]|uniref:Class I SAM-dependent methyltransferase n=1 Tax=Natronoglycomyces albus TaxID=2811108 RepID=A0A895XMU6_9ACTN|nr:class I SAM-dependent methyltransferase [Natronoglycomyces albus]QSB06674.1 class I SAM-dependent methyltransferase [Natronoglycomyces albus]
MIDREAVSAAADAAWRGGPVAGPQLASARDRAALLSMHAALHCLAPTQRFDAASLARKGGVAARHAPIVDRWLEELAAHDIVRRHEQQWEWNAEPPARQAVDAAWQTARELAPRRGEGRALTDFFARCAEHWRELLTDTIGAQTLLFEDEAITTEIYQTNAASRYTNAAAAEALAQCLEQHHGPTAPSALEIGGGMGGTTDVVLDRIRHLAADYHFTDVSRWFLERGRDRWAGRCGLTTGFFDINDPAAWESPPRRFDVVLAANVFHNAHDPAMLSRRLRSVANDSGHLVMIETHIEHLPLLMSMRFLMSPPTAKVPFTDERANNGRIFLPMSQWRQHLQDNGWTVLDLVPTDPAETESDQLAHPVARFGQHVLIAAAAKE